MIQVHPQLEEGVTGHGVLPNQQMFKLSLIKETRYLHIAFQGCKRFLAPEHIMPLTGTFLEEPLSATQRALGRRSVPQSLIEGEIACSSAKRFRL
jgi:hypothetical protein